MVKLGRVGHAVELVYALSPGSYPTSIIVKDGNVSGCPRPRFPIRPNAKEPLWVGIGGLWRIGHRRFDTIAVMDGNDDKNASTAA